jgi:hypothetical protein
MRAIVAGVRRCQTICNASRAPDERSVNTPISTDTPLTPWEAGFSIWNRRESRAVKIARLRKRSNAQTDLHSCSEAYHAPEVCSACRLPGASLHLESNGLADGSYRKSADVQSVPVQAYALRCMSLLSRCASQSVRSLREFRNLAIFTALRK